MSTIGGLYLPKFETLDYGRTVNQGILGASQQVQGQTELVRLAELKRQQEEAEAARLFMQQHPEFVLGGGGPPQSLIGSLQTAPGGPPAGGPMTQQPFGPGGVGPTPPVPASPDASRFAGVSPQGGGPIPPDLRAQTMPTVTPPQSTIGALGPQPQPQAPHPQQQLFALARAGHPEAALKLQALMQGQQDQQWKLEERRLDMGVKVAEGVARELNSVRDQASLDAARERIRHYHPHAAAQIPQFYSKEALEPLIMKGVAVADLAKWRKDQATAQQTQMMTERLPRVFGALEQFATGGGGTQEPAPSPAPTAASPTGQQARTAPPEFESAITEANRLYPQVPVTRIKSIIAAESNFDPRAVSSAGAKGPMQLMDTTAKDMGVEDPFNVRQNVDGGTRYYAQLLTKYGGDERKALAAYNWGPANLDKVGGDVSKAPPETQAYVQKVLSGGGGGGGTGTAQAPASNPRVAQLDADITRGNALALQVSMIPGMETAAATLRAQVENLTQERTRLLEESRHQRERREETPRAVEKEQALQPLKLEQQRAAAEVSLEAKMNEPIGPENALNMNLPPQTRWKDVPKDVKITKQLGETTAKHFSEFKASHAGLGRVLTMLDNPAAKSIIGTLFSGDNAAFRRQAGQWISSVTPQERKVVASLVSEIADIRHTLSGSAVSAPEAEFLQPMMPSAADPDVGTVRAKLEALQEWMTRKHDAYRDQFEQSGYRVPAALARTAEKPAPTGSGNVDRFKAVVKP